MLPFWAHGMSTAQSPVPASDSSFSRCHSALHPSARAIKWLAQNKPTERAGSVLSVAGGLLG